MSNDIQGHTHTSHVACICHPWMLLLRVTDNMPVEVTRMADSMTDEVTRKTGSTTNNQATTGTCMTTSPMGQKTKKLKQTKKSACHISR